MLLSLGHYGIIILILCYGVIATGIQGFINWSANELNSLVKDDDQQTEIFAEGYRDAY